MPFAYALVVFFLEHRGRDIRSRRDLDIRKLQFLHFRDIRHSRLGIESEPALVCEVGHNMSGRFVSELPDGFNFDDRVGNHHLSSSEKTTLGTGFTFDVPVLRRVNPKDRLTKQRMPAVKQVQERKRNRFVRERALILAAGKLFASRGYDATTTREIAACAGCAEGLIHRYFSGKEGLLLALIRFRVSEEVGDLSDKLQRASNVEDEILQLVKWEVDRMWEDRDFLRVIIPRAILDPTLGPVVSRIGPALHAQAIAKRLRKYHEGRALPDDELEALANFIGVIGFMFGFMRPVVLGRDRIRTKKMATTIAKLLTRNLSHPSESRSERPRHFNAA